MTNPLLAVVLILFTVACTRQVRIEPLGYAIVEVYPAQVSSYAKYRSETAGAARDAQYGPWIVCYLKSGSDIRSIAESKGMHHLGFSLFQCPKPAPHDYSFYGDRVFDLSSEDLARLGSLAEDDLFKVYVPIKLDEVIENSPFLHWPEEKALVSDNIRQHGLCLRFEAGAMTGFALESNIIELPVMVDPSPLRISSIERGEEID
jgi:hypothetical protein